MSREPGVSPIEAVILDQRQGLVVSAPYTDRVTILGKGPSAKRARADGGERWEMNTGPIVAVNRFGTDAPTFAFKNGAVGAVDEAARVGTRWFQIHIRSILSEREEAWLRLCPTPIYTVRVEKGLPNSVRYPLERILDTFGAGVPLSSSFDYALALAVAEGFTRITTAGIDLQRGAWRERLCEHPAHAFWMGLATGRGVAVTNLSMSVKTAHRYGIDYWAEALWGRRECANALLTNANIHDFGASPAALRRLLRLW